MQGFFTSPVVLSLHKVVDPRVCVRTQFESPRPSTDVGGHQQGMTSFSVTALLRLFHSRQATVKAMVVGVGVCLLALT